MSIQQGTIAAKIVGINQTKNGLSSVLEQWGEEVPQTFGAYPNAFNNVFENLDEKIDAVSASLSDYLPLSGGTVDKLSVDSPEFYVRNLLSVNVENDKMGGLMLGSNIYNITPPVVDGDKQCAPILIGNDLQSPDGVPMPSIAVGNNAIVRYGGIAIGGATGMSYEYDFGIGSANVEAVHIINPLRRDVVLSTLQFVDENGDTATSALYASDRITIVAPNGVQTTYYVSGTGKWGHNVQKQVGRRIVNVWEDADDSVVLAQQSVAYYSHYTPQYLKLKFDPEEINSVDMGAAELFSIAIGNNTMAGAYLSSDGSYQQSPFAGAIAIGAGSIAKDKGTVVIGSNSVAEGNKSIAFGFNAFTSADNAIQFGTGTNDTPRSFQINDVNIVKDNYDSSLSSWTGYKLNPDLLPDGTVLSNDLSAYLPLTGGTISSDTFKWLMSNGSSNMLSVDPVGGNYALGNSSEAGPYLALAIGTNAHATGGAVAIGGLNAWANGDNSIQIGQGTNNTAGTTQIKNWQLLDANGNIPEARLSSVGYAKASSIPTVNNGTLTIQKNGSTVQTFSANQSTAVTANIAVPTKTSELTNDSNFLTAHQDLTDYAKKNDLSVYLSSETDPVFDGWLSGSQLVNVGLSSLASADISSVPYDAELEYIEKTGNTQSYFDTGFTPLWNDKITSKWSTDVNKTMFFYMAREAANKPSRGFLKMATSGQFRADRTNGTGAIVTNFSPNVPAYTLSTWFEVFDDGTGSLQMIGLRCGYNGTPNTASSGTINGTLRLFDGASGNSWGQMKFGYMRIFSGVANDDTAVLKLDLIPVRVGTTPYVYDRVSKTLIAKGGADDLVCGPDKRRTAVAIGSQAFAEERSVAIGSTANAVDSVINKFGSVAIGEGAKAVEGIAIGPDAEADCSNYNLQSNAVAIGKNAYAKGISVAIGTNAQSGKRTNTNAYMGISIGRNAGPREDNRDQVIDIALNSSHPSMGNYSIGVGGAHGSTGERGIAIGYSASAGGTRATAVGESSNGSGDTAICYGRDARASGKHAMALGFSSRSNAEKAIAIGMNAQCTAANTIAIGSAASAYENSLSGSVQFWDWTAFKRNEDNTNLLLDADRLPDDVVFVDDLSAYAETSAVNTAIGTINDNLSGIATFLASGYAETAQCDVGSRATGWTYSPNNSNWTNKIRFFHWGQLGLFFGYAKCSSDIAANSTVSNIGTIAFPSGYSVPVATFGTRSVNYILTMGSNGAMGIRTFAKITANSSINLGFMCMLGNVGDRWSRTNVSTI